MITTKSGYRFIDVDDVDISGMIIPKKEVMGLSSDEMKHEDICFLYEAIYQRLSNPVSKPTKESVSDCLSAYKLNLNLNWVKSNGSSMYNISRPDVFNNNDSLILYLTYVNAGSTISTGFRSGSINRNSIIQGIGALDTLLINGITVSTGDALLHDKIRRLYGDLSKFKRGVTISLLGNDYTKIQQTGTWTDDIEDPTGSSYHYSGTVTVDTDFKAHLRSQFPLATPYIRKQYNRCESGSTYYDTSQISITTIDSFKISNVLKNVSQVWAAIEWYGSWKTKSASSISSGSCYELIPLTATTNPYTGFTSAWNIPSSYLTSSHALEAFAFMGGVEAAPITDNEESYCFHEIYLNTHGVYIVTLPDTFLTAEVESLGWSYS